MNNGVKPNIVTFTSFIDAYAKAGDTEEVEHWFQKAVDNGVKPNIVTFDAVIYGYRKAGLNKEAEQWVQMAMEYVKARYSTTAPSMVAPGSWGMARGGRGVVRILNQDSGSD